MFKRGNSQVNVDELMTKIRQEVAQRQRQDNITETQSASDSIKIDWQKLDSNLGMARQFANIGREVPSFAHYRGPLQLLAHWTGRLVIFFSSFITEQQRQFNGSVLQLLGSFYDELKKLEKELATKDIQIANLTERIRIISAENAQHQATPDLETQSEIAENTSKECRLSDNQGS
ncbi:MAG: hypothetical protein AB1489_25210 [Acidobacteriota bacterium]